MVSRRRLNGLGTCQEDTTKIRLVKLAQDTGAGLSGARFEVLDSSGTKVLEFTSNKDGYDITGKLAVGQSYTFRETEAPRGYKLADSVIYTVLDTADLQTISVTDEKNPNPHVPQTGGVTPFLVAALALAVLAVAGILTWHRCRKKRLP